MIIRSHPPVLVWRIRHEHLPRAYIRINHLLYSLIGWTVEVGGDFSRFLPQDEKKTLECSPDNIARGALTTVVVGKSFRGTTPRPRLDGRQPLSARSARPLSGGSPDTCACSTPCDWLDNGPTSRATPQRISSWVVEMVAARCRAGDCAHSNPSFSASRVCLWTQQSTAALSRPFASGSWETANRDTKDYGVRSENELRITLVRSEGWRDQPTPIRNPAKQGA